MTELVAPVFTELIWILGAGLLGLLSGLFALVRAGSSKPLAPLLHGLAPGLIVLGVVLGGLAGMANPDVVTGLVAACMLRLLGALVLWPLVGGLALGFSVIAWAQGEIDRTRMAVLGALALAPAALSLVGGLLVDDPVLASVRAVLVTTLGLVAIPALGSKAPGPALAAALGHALLVGMVEGASRAMVAFFALTTSISQLPSEKREAGIDAMLATVEAETLWIHLAVLLGMALPVANLGFLARARTLERRHLMSGGLFVFAWLALAVGVPDRADLVAAALGAP